MSHYEERLERDLAQIRGQLSLLAERIDTAIDQSTHAMLAGDDELASRTIIEDNPINRLTRDLDRHCHSFIVRHLPSAGVLRFVSSVLRLTVAFERIGDYACSISREALMLSKHPPKAVAKDIELMLGQSRENLRQATAAFVAGDDKLARTTLQAAYDSRKTFGKLYADLLKVGAKQSRPPQDLFAFLITFYRLERITDQARNICEETFFTVQGVAKRPRTHRILFVDERDDCLAPLAAALARKAYPDAGVYASAGWAPAERLDPAAEAYLAGHGLADEEHTPTALPLEHDALLAYDIVIAVTGALRERLSDLPFRTVLLHWNLEPPPDDGGDGRDRLAAAHHALSQRLQELMELLVGEEAG